MTRALYRLSLLCGLACAHCTPADRAGIPVVSQIDRAGMAIARIAGWCEEQGAPKREVVQIIERYRGGEIQAATLEALILVNRMQREHGVEVPPDVQRAIEIAAIEGLQNGMRALSRDGGA